mgnify:CR=1 FL=1
MIIYYYGVVDFILEILKLGFSILLPIGVTYYSDKNYKERKGIWIKQLETIYGPIQYQIDLYEINDIDLESKRKIKWCI